MKRPFNISPSVGFKNEKFQVITTIDNILIEIYYNNKLIKKFNVNSNEPTKFLIDNLVGKLIVKCNLNNVWYCQNIEIKNAIRFGSSEFKKSFVFSDSQFSFYLMKDRLLIFNETSKISLIENFISPTEIIKLNANNYLFLTKINNSINTIINLCVYNTETFSIQGELLNKYHEIVILPKSNKAWLLNIEKSTVHCFELITEESYCFKELYKAEDFLNFFFEDSNQYLFINYNEKIKIIHTININENTIIPKLTNNAIDKFGNEYKIDKIGMVFKNYFFNLNIQYSQILELNLLEEDFIHLGKNLRSKIEFSDIEINIEIEKIKDSIINSIPEKTNSYIFRISDGNIYSNMYKVEKIFPTKNGLFILDERISRFVKEIKFFNENDTWLTKPLINERKSYSLYFMTPINFEILIEKEINLNIKNYCYPFLFIESSNSLKRFKTEKKLFLGNKKVVIESGNQIEEFIKIENNLFFIFKKNEKFTVYDSLNLNFPILNSILIYNYNYIKSHLVFWYSNFEENQSNSINLKLFDLRNYSDIAISDRIYNNLTLQKLSNFIFSNNYVLYRNRIIINPKNFEIINSISGKIISYSEKIEKIITRSRNEIQLNIFKNKNNEIIKIPFEKIKYNEAYLSLNGKFMVLKDENDVFKYFEIENKVIEKFYSGNFITALNEGSIIKERDNRRLGKLINPNDIQYIKYSNYHNYRFLSPDGKLYAQIVTKKRYLNILTNKELSLTELNILKENLDYSPNQNHSDILRINRNRNVIFENHIDKFEEIGIKDFTNITSEDIIRVDNYLEIGIVGKENICKIILPKDLEFYNYGAFSFDNKYFAYVGKPSSKGLINIFKIDFDENNSSLTVKNSFLSRVPKFASWVCGFSKTGYFATYDSKPDTYVIFMANELFKNKKSGAFNNEYFISSEFDNQFINEKWKIIYGMNFLCFSPSGKFIALSEEGYQPLTLGGYGHQESNAVHIAKTTSCEIIDSFTGHGGIVEFKKQKKATFVAFSADEKRLMTLSSDGVVILRELNLDNE